MKPEGRIKVTNNARLLDNNDAAELKYVIHLKQKML